MRRKLERRMGAWGEEKKPECTPESCLEREEIAGGFPRCLTISEKRKPVDGRRQNATMLT